MIIPDNTNIGTASNGKLSIPPSIERITNCPLAVNDGSNAPGSTDTIPRAIEIGIAMIKQTKKSKNTTAADIYFSSFSSSLRITILNSMIQRWMIRNATKTKLNSGAA